MSLPPPVANQAFCNVSALEGGQVDIPLHFFITRVKEDEIVTAPALAFIIQHFQTKANFVFDLGIRHDVEKYPRIVLERIRNGPFFSKIAIDVPAFLEKGGLPPSEVTTVCLSHCHWDHAGDPSQFPNATFLTGVESRTLFNPGYPDDPDSGFDSNLLPAHRTRFLSPASWPPLGPFPRALDFYGDGSLYIIDAPGHLPGHINVLARTSADGGWIYLAADSMVDRRLLSGEAQMVEGSHRDTQAAEEHAGRIRKLVQENEKVRVMLAHDAGWYSENKGGSAFWPGKIPSL
ncbi:hypothetical protein JAAARDRAFT_30312 [Jaapia argillacea MUCL 33604]|uniref:Metallo-beta-lactamase domain-containing protein n=1 Tax=Jaapia argillacea MUCL 33604 TaxID=933084 RepID=A0A067QII2_9AGAM|nr:hypothetical protein JAAARDRAFT_30312 [Jaapia argillacea MUCL 33604]